MNLKNIFRLSSSILENMKQRNIYVHCKYSNLGYRKKNEYKKINFIHVEKNKCKK